MAKSKNKYFDNYHGPARHDGTDDDHNLKMKKSAIVNIRPFVDFEKKWVNSTMGQKLLNNSVEKDKSILRKIVENIYDLDSSNYTKTLTKEFNKNLDNVESKEWDETDEARNNKIMGTYKGDEIKINPNPRYQADLKNTITHEVSHVNNYLMPKSDKNFIKNISTNIKDTGKDEYIKDPGEFRASLQTSRKYLTEKGVDIFNKPITDDDMKLLKNRTFKKNENWGYDHEMIKLYGEKNYLEALNTISDKTKLDNNNNYT
jgi:hypothetical protein